MRAKGTIDLRGRGKGRKPFPPTPLSARLQTWFPLTIQVCLNGREWLSQALANVQDTASLEALTEKLCQPTTWKGQRVRALNLYGPEDLALLKAVARGEFNLNGFRNRDLAKLLYAADQEPTATEQRRQSSAITRKLRLLRAHGLIKKVPKTHRYHLTAAGSKAITAIIAALQVSLDSLIKLAA